MPTVDDALSLLRQHAQPGALEGMARFGMDVDKRLGVSVGDIRKTARILRRDHELALALWETGIPDAQILAGIVADPARLGSRQMDAWVRDMRSWDVCDGACLNAFVRSPLAWDKVHEWAPRQAEFTRRAGFALLATLAVHDKDAPDQRFIDALPLIESASDDDRNFVRKAVNWALRNIGKRNTALNAEAIACAERIRARGTKAARWIASDALRELKSDAQQDRLRRIATNSG